MKILRFCHIRVILKVPSLLVEFGKRLNDEIMAEINEMIIAYNTPDDPGQGDGGGKDSDEVPSEQENSGTMILSQPALLKT